MKADKNRLYNDVKFLTDLRPFRNYKNVESLNRAAEYIKTEFEKTGMKVSEQTWIAAGNEYKNIIAEYNSGAKRKLVIGGHYDVAGDQPGADDNASAVAGLLETARLMAEQKPDIDHSVVFVAYSLEEPPFFGGEEMGSYVHAKSLKDTGADVLGMICYEMIGYFSDEPGSQKQMFFESKEEHPDKGNFIVMIGRDGYEAFNDKVLGLMKEKQLIDVHYIISEKNGSAAYSDNRNYSNMGYPAVMINDTTYLRNPNYHKITDTIDTLDFDRMADVVSVTYHAAINLE